MEKTAQPVENGDVLSSAATQITGALGGDATDQALANSVAVAVGAATGFTIDNAAIMAGAQAGIANEFGGVGTTIGGLIQGESPSAPPGAPIGNIAGAVAGAIGPNIVNTVVDATISGLPKLFDPKQELSFTEEAALALPTFGLSFLADPIKKLFGGGKGEEQQQRDQIRAGLQQAGFADQDFKIKLADGSTFDIGSENVKDAAGNTTGKIYTLPWDKEITPRTVGLAQVLSAAVVGEKDFYTESATMMFANAAMSNAGDDFTKVTANIRTMAKNLGLTQANVEARIKELFRSGQIDADKAEVLLNDARTIFGENTVQASGNGSAAGGEKRLRPLSPQQFPDFARPTLSGYTLEELLAAGWDMGMLNAMLAEGFRGVGSCGRATGRCRRPIPRRRTRRFTRASRSG
ncbi:MAG: hypothetical protein FJX76_22520 [Armatimonadetes bacterium]|nr:hypothetical protein [Armatimonadota bacterium]